MHKPAKVASDSPPPSVLMMDEHKPTAVGIRPLAGNPSERPNGPRGHLRRHEPADLDAGSRGRVRGYTRGARRAQGYVI